MSRILPAHQATPQDALSVIGRPKPAKVTPEDSQPDTLVSSLLFEAARAAHGKIESAAGEVGKDRANFTRDMKRWAQVLDALGPQFLAKFGQGLVEQYGDLSDPKSRARQLIEVIEAAARELRQYVESL